MMTYFALRYRLFGWMALCAWGITLALPVQSGEAGYGYANGFNALLFGWLEHPAWLANAGFFWIVALLIRKAEPPRRSSFALAIATAALALSAFSWDNALDELQAAQQFAVGFGRGFYAWVLIVCLTSAVLLLRVLKVRLFLPGHKQY